MKKPTYIKAAKLALNKVNESSDETVDAYLAQIDTYTQAELDSMRSELAEADAYLTDMIASLRKQTDRLLAGIQLRAHELSYAKSHDEPVSTSLRTLDKIKTVQDSIAIRQKRAVSALQKYLDVSAAFTS